MFQQIESRSKYSNLKKFCRYRFKQENERSELKINRIKLKMANTLSVMTNVLRNVVSKQRIRYKEKGFNLDLAYICDNIIAMGYPADSIESIYRNRIEDVYKFLEENHHDHYKIYNLCLERNYDINKFHGRVAVYPFEDHNPPTIELIQNFCHDVDCWLKSDTLNVAAIHCKAGKGRTGTMICCYLLYSRHQGTAEDALSCYGEKRTKDRKGVTIPSQRRYVQYFSKLIQSELPYEKRTLQFCEIRFADANLLQSQGAVNCSISVLYDSSIVKILQTHTIDFRKNLILEINNPSLSVTGDIKVELTHKTSRKKIFHFWFNTYFVCDTADIEDDGEYRKLVYTLHKNEIDDAHKDKEHKYFSEDLKVQLFFLPISSVGQNNTDINILQQSGNDICHETSQDLKSTQYNLMLPQNSSRSSNLNYFCDQKSLSSASVCSISANRATSKLVGQSAQENVDGLMQQPSCAPNAEVPSERIRISTGSIPPFFNKSHNEKPMPVTSAPTENYKNQFGSELFFANQHHRLQQHSHQPQHPSANAMQLSRINHNKEDVGTLNSNCINTITVNRVCNSNECSSSSISSRSSSSAVGDNEEDWESGESSAKPLAHKSLFSYPASNLNTSFSLKSYNSSSCFKNNIGDDNDDDKIRYYNRKDYKAPVVYASDLGKAFVCRICCLRKSSSSNGNTCLCGTERVDKQVLEEKFSITPATQHQINNKQISEQRPLIVAAATTNKNPLSKRKSFKSSNAITSTSQALPGSEATCSSITTSSGSSHNGLVPTSKQKLKIRLKKK